MKKFQPLGGGGPRKGPPTKRLGTCGRPLILSDQERFRRDSCSQGDGNDDMAVVTSTFGPGAIHDGARVVQSAPEVPSLWEWAAGARTSY